MNRLLAWLAVLFVMAFSGWWLWPYLLPAAGQVSQQQVLFLKKAAQHDWKHVAALVAADYHDGAGMDKQQVLQTAQEILDPFPSVDFDWNSSSVVVDDKKATLTGTLRMRAAGTASSMVTDRVNQIRDPWIFVWRKDGWNPGDWRLISVSNSEVENLAH